MLSRFRRAARIAGVQAIARALALTGDPYAAVSRFRSDRDPYEFFERLRAKGDLLPSRLGAHVAVSHDLCRAVLRDTRFGVAPLEEITPVSLALVRDGKRVVNPAQDSFIMRDPPDHGRLRRGVQRFFTPRALREWVPVVTRIAGECLDAVDGSGFDLVGDYATAVPVHVIAELLGVPKSEHPRFVRWGSTVVRALDGVWSLAQLDELHGALAELNDFFDELIAFRRRNPADDVLSHLVITGGDRDDIVATTGLLLFAGFETSANLIGNGVLKAIEHPHTVVPLSQDLGYAEGFADETLRMSPPVLYTARIARQPVRLAGTEIDQGQPVMLVLGAANRDSAVFADPFTFDPLRANAREHLSFSDGAHYCLGAGLARMEGAIALHELFRRFPRLELDGAVTKRTSRLLRGPLHLPLRAAVFAAELPPEASLP